MLGELLMSSKVSRGHMEISLLSNVCYINIFVAVLQQDQNVFLIGG